MPYEKQVAFTGDPAKALESGREAFVLRGFQVSAIKSSSFEARRSGMHSTKQDPLVGVSVATITVAGGMISVQAEFGNVRRLIVGLGIFLLAMGVGFVLLFGLWFGRKGGLIVLAALSPWPVGLPLMGVVTRKRSKKALDTLIDNMATVAGDK